MAGPKSFLAPGQQHQLFRRTAKNLLRLHDANRQHREGDEIRRLEKYFGAEQVTLQVRHPKHGVMAEGLVPIVSNSENVFNGFHKLKVHCTLPEDGWRGCEAALLMPGGLELLIFPQLYNTGDYLPNRFLLERATDATKAAEITMPLLGWNMVTGEHELSHATCFEFVNDHFSESFCLTLDLSVICAYPTSLDVPRAERELVRKAMATEVVGATWKIEAPHSRSGLAYFRTMESWMIIARQVRDDATEFARLRSRFEKTYLLVEVSVPPGGDPRKGPETVSDEDGEEKERKGAMGIFAFVLAPLVDEAGLMNIFSSHSTRLQYVEREGIGRSDRLPPSRYVQVSVLDIGENRVMKVGGCCLLETSADECILMYRCTCAFLDRLVHVTASFDEEAATCGEEGDGHVATFQLHVHTARVEEGEDVGREEQEFASVLEVWKFLELCMTGTACTRDDHL